MGGWPRHSRGGWMAETSGPRGPCTAPRRRCSPAWPWIATAWARPRPDACPPRACPARCRPGSTWPASTSTRTRVSVLRYARPFLSPPGSWGGRPREELLDLSPPIATGARCPLSLGRCTGVRAGSAPGAGRPLGPEQRPVRRPRQRGARGSAAFSGEPGTPKAHVSAKIGATSDDSNPGALAARAWGRVLKIWARKEQTSLTPFETSAPPARNLFRANALAGSSRPGFRS